MKPKPPVKKVQLRAPGGTLPSVKEAVKAGADGVYTAFCSTGNVRNFPGLNLSEEELLEALDYAHHRGSQVFVAVNSYPQGKLLATSFREIEKAAQYGVDGVILADIGLMRFARRNFPNLPIQVSVQAGASTVSMITLLKEEFGIKGVVLPRVLSLSEIEKIRKLTDVEIEVFAFGLLCINFEPKCLLSCYLTGIPNTTFGACSPAQLVTMTETDGRLEMRLDGYLLNSFDPGQDCTYPTPCKGRYRETETGKVYYPFQGPSSLNVLPVLPRLIESGIDVLKIEGRQRSKTYVRETVRVFREAIDSYYRDPEGYELKSDWQKRLARLFEGANFILAAYGDKS